MELMLSDLLSVVSRCFSALPRHRLARRTYDNPRRLLETLRQNAEWVDEAVNAPTVAGLVGLFAMDDLPFDAALGMDGASNSFDAALNLLGPPPEFQPTPGGTNPAPTPIGAP